MKQSKRQWAGLAVMVCFGFCAARTSGADGTWTNNASGVWSNTACWVGGTPADGAISTATFAGPTSGITGDTTVTLDAPRTIGNLLFTNNNGHTWFLAGSNLTFDADGSGGSTSTVCVATNAAQFNLKMRGTTNSVLNKTGAGQLVLGADNTGCYSGRVVVTQGSLALNNANATVSTRGLTLGGGDDNVSVGFANNGTQNGSTFTVAGSGAGTVTFWWNTANSITISLALTLNKTTVFNVSQYTFILNSQPSGAGGVYKTGAGALGLFANGNATYSGTTTVSQGGITLVNNGGYGLPVGNAVVMGDTNTGASGVSFTLGNSSAYPNVNLRVTTNGTSASIMAGVNGYNIGSHSWNGTIQIDRPYLTVGCNSMASSLTIGSTISGAGGVWVNNTTGYRTSVSGANTVTV